MDETPQSEQINHLDHELDALILRFVLEYDLPYASIVGVFQMKVSELILNALDVVGGDC